MEIKAVHNGAKEADVGGSPTSDRRGAGKNSQFGKNNVIKGKKTLGKPIVKPTENNDE
jgi:hypothetical protein